MTDEEEYRIDEREWHLDDCLEKLRPRRTDSLSDRFTAHSRLFLKENDVTDDILLQGYAVMANIVKIHGDQYLPIFERLHSEIEDRKTTRKLLDRALQVAKDSTHFPQ